MEREGRIVWGDSNRYIMLWRLAPGGNSPQETGDKIPRGRSISPRLPVVQVRGVETIDLTATDRFLRSQSVILTPKFNHRKSSHVWVGYINGNQRTIRSEEIIKPEVGIVGREGLDEMRGGSGRYIY